MLSVSMDLISDITCLYSSGIGSTGSWLANPNKEVALGSQVLLMSLHFVKQYGPISLYGNLSLSWLLFLDS